MQHQQASLPIKKNLPLLENIKAIRNKEKKIKHKDGTEIHFFKEIDLDEENRFKLDVTAENIVEKIKFLPHRTYSTTNLI